MHREESYGNALQSASYEGHEAIAKLLIDNGSRCQMHREDLWKCTPGSIIGGHEAIAKLLIDKGADVNAQGGGPGKCTPGSII
jgi:ankyrin repeat protein